MIAIIANTLPMISDHAKFGPPRAIEHLKKVVLDNGNIFGALMEAVRHCSPGQITKALYAVGGKYRRNM